MKLLCSACKGTGKLLCDGSPCDCCICGAKGWRWVPKSTMLPWQIAESLKLFPPRRKNRGTQRSTYWPAQLELPQQKSIRESIMTTTEKPISIEVFMYAKSVYLPALRIGSNWGFDANCPLWVLRSLIWDSLQPDAHNRIMEIARSLENVTVDQNRFADALITHCIREFFPAILRRAAASERTDIINRDGLEAAALVCETSPSHESVVSAMSAARASIENYGNHWYGLPPCAVIYAGYEYVASVGKKPRQKATQAKRIFDFACPSVLDTPLPGDGQCAWFTRASDATVKFAEKVRELAHTSILEH